MLSSPVQYSLLTRSQLVSRPTIAPAQPASQSRLMKSGVRNGSSRPSKNHRMPILSRLNLLAMVSAILSEADLPASFLELELTEAVAMRDPAAAVALMDQLHERGIRMSIDDFGTGYSSLSYLKRFKVYKLKIDQSFVRDLLDDPEDRAIVTAIISMAHSMGMQTIAEGVETGAQLEFLRQQGCDEVQGYYFSKPVAAPQLEAFVRGGLDGLNLLQNT